MGWTQAQLYDSRSWGAKPTPYQQSGQGQNSGSGRRYKLFTNEPFPSYVTEQSAVCRDEDGRSPVFFASAYLKPDSIHPGKVAPDSGNSIVGVPYGGKVVEFHGQYDLLPFTNEMELVPTHSGLIPAGRQPIVGGYEDNYRNPGHNVLLYHAIAVVDGVKVPGKAGEHLRGCCVAFQGRDVFCGDYDLLCWKN